MVTDQFTHKCTEADCPLYGQPTRSTSCKCHISREEMMALHIEELMISLDKLQLLRRELRGADDEALIALCEGNSSIRNENVESAIHHLHKAASLLGFVLVQKDDGK